MDMLAQKIWYESNWLPRLLAPLAWLYRALLATRSWLYRKGLMRVRRLAVPVIIIGNITVGGTGKTPLAIWLSQRLRREGYVPGILSRGYKGASGDWPVMAMLHSDPAIVGDEALVLVRRSGCRVAVGPDRAAAAALLLKEGVNLIISDDGLQHMKLARDFEILVIDGERRFGNGRCLPAGPLREPVARMAKVDVIVQNGGTAMLKSSLGTSVIGMSLRQLVAVPLTGGETRRLSDFRGGPVHALAGIGNPERFFRQLENLDIEIIRHPFPDHAPLGMDDILFMDNYPVLMTEKDAVKCTAFADQRHFYVPVTAELRESDAQLMMDRLNAVLTRKTAKATNVSGAQT